MLELFGFLFFNSILFRTSCLFILGSCLGSFFNVVVYRLPLVLLRNWRNECIALLGSECQITPQTRGINLIHPSSHCPKCNGKIPVWANIPLVGYFMVGGRCIHCGLLISPRYPIVELISGLLFVALGFTLGQPLELIGGMIFIGLILCLILIDYDTLLLPDELTLPLLWLGLLFNLHGGICGGLSNAVLGAVSGYLILWLIYWAFKLLTKKEGMGYGDFKLLAACGAWLGWHNLVSILILSSVSGVIYAVILYLGGKLERDKPIPFGPFLGSAAIITFLFMDQLLPIISY